MAEEQQINPTHDGTGELPPPALPRTYGLPEGSTAEPRTTWPEVVGLTAEEAERKIKEDKPGAQIQVIPPDSFVTMDFKSGRVRLHVDSSGKVRMLPRIG